MAKKETRGAKPLAPVTLQGDVMDGGKLADRDNQLQVLAKAEAAVRQFAENIGYAGSLDVETLWSAVEFRQRRSVEDILEMGRGLLLIKEQSAHGEFMSECARRGIHQRLVNRFMGVALKFSKLDSVSILAAAGTQAKVLELTVLDDEEVEALNSGESVAGIVLDDVERMSASQLREAFRKHRANKPAELGRAQAREEEIRKLQTKLDEASNFLRVTKPDKAGEAMLVDLGALLRKTRTGVEQATEAAQTLLEHARQHKYDYTKVLDEQFTGLANDVAYLAGQLNLAGIHGPSQRLNDALKGA